MTHVSITEARKRFSALLREVRRGETVLITDRGAPVATIRPVRESRPGESESIARLVRRGVLIPPREPLDLDRCCRLPLPRLPDGVSASDAVSRDREESF